MRFLSLLITAMSLLSLGGCASLGDDVTVGYLFTYKRVPFTVDLDNTPADGREAGGKIIQIKEPFTGYGLYTEINTNAIADIAREHGMTKVYYADMEELIILAIFRHRKLYIYGE